MSKKSLKKLDEYVQQQNPNKEDLSEFVRELAYLNNPTDRTITVRYSQIKKYIRDNYPQFDEEFLKTLTPPMDLTKKVISENKERKLTRKMVEFDQKLVEDILELRDSDNPYEVSIFLQFVSGRRVNELYDNDIRINSKSPREVSMRLSKKSSGSRNKYHKFNLLKDTITNKRFKDKLMKMRSSVNGVSLADFTNRVNRKIKQLLRKDLSTHDLRGIYAVFGFNTENDDDLNLLGYINKVLNHESQSLDSSQSYASFKYVA